MAQKPKEKELGGNRNMSTSTKIIIGIFSVLMALTMMLPSFAAIFASDNVSADQQADAAQDEQTQDAQAEEETDDAADTKSDAKGQETLVGIEDVPDNETLQSYVDQYGDDVKKYVARLEENPTNLAALLNLGQTYMNWGSSATSSASTDEETEYAESLVKQAMEYFDRYLALNDSNTVKVDRALCQFYLGDTAEATEAMQDITVQSPDFALAWANLGYMYESQFNSEQAAEAYRKAAAADADGSYGVKSYANQRLVSLSSSTSEEDKAKELVNVPSQLEQQGLSSSYADTLKLNN